MTANVTIRLLTIKDQQLLAGTGDDVFDGPAMPTQAAAFLADPRHHIAGAIETSGKNARLISFASAVHYEHPDKPTELWINEVGVADSHHRQGIGLALMNALLDHGRTLGCREAWVLTEHDNAAARGLYKSSGGTESPAIMVSFGLSQDQKP